MNKKINSPYNEIIGFKLVKHENILQNIFYRGKLVIHCKYCNIIGLNLLFGFTFSFNYA